MILETNVCPFEWESDGHVYMCSVPADVAHPHPGTWCTGCGQPNDGANVDFGRGWTEYWGSWKNDVHYEFVSTCCEAPLANEYVREPPEEM